MTAAAIASTADGVTLKGTRHGLLLCIREDLDLSEVLAQVESKLGSDQPFLAQAELSLDLGWRELDEEGFNALVDGIQARDHKVQGVLSTSYQTRSWAEKRGLKAIIGRLGLAQHQGRQLRQQPAAEPTEVKPEVPEAVPASPPAATAGEREQEATLYIKRTLRSGQKACYPGNIVLWGDLNPGAELEAEGDIVVLGTVRGRLHAGCAGNASAEIFCQSLHPCVVRIADGIWTGEAAEAKVKLPATVRIRCHKDQLQFEASK